MVGIGGAGNNLLSHAISEGMSAKNCVAVNTDRGQLSGSPAGNKVLLSMSTNFGTELTRHAVGNMELLAHRIAPFTRSSDFTILLTGLGGETGTRAAPVVAQLHRTQVRPVVSVVALPFIHERERRFVALRGLKKIVESCDCTVVIDNAVQKRTIGGGDRVADETASTAVYSLSDVIAMGDQGVTRRILDILSLGSLATICTSRLESSDMVQSAVIDALRTPSANLPITKAKGAVMIFRGSERLSVGEAALAYDAIVSLLGHDVEFIQVSSKSQAPPRVAILLTGYTYGSALDASVDLIQDLYDMEYGSQSGSAEVELPTRLYQMEKF